MACGDIRYAVTADGVSIAYATRGAGPDDLVFIPGFAACFDIELEEPHFARLIEAMAARWRVVLFYKGGSGLSDRQNTPDLEMRADQLPAALHAVGSEAAILVGAGEGGDWRPFLRPRIPNGSRRSSRSMPGPGSRGPRTTQWGCLRKHTWPTPRIWRRRGARWNMRGNGRRLRCQARVGMRASSGGWHGRCATPLRPLPPWSSKRQLAQLWNVWGSPSSNEYVASLSSSIGGSSLSRRGLRADGG